MANEVRLRGGQGGGQKSRAPAVRDDEDTSKQLRKNEHLAWSVWDWPYFLGITIVAIVTRFYRITEPAGIVFDEVHFGKFTNWYLKRWFSFDIHPPLGKLTFMAAGLLTGYEESRCDYEPPAGHSHMYAPDCQYYLLRGTAAIFSVAGVVLVYLLSRRLGGSPVGATVSALLIALDMLNVTEGRLVLMDSQVNFCIVFAQRLENFVSTFCLIM